MGDAGCDYNLESFVFRRVICGLILLTINLLVYDFVKIKEDELILIKDDFKRRFVMNSLRVGSALVFSPLLARNTFAKGDFAKNDFEDYKSGMSAGLFGVEGEFVQYKRSYSQAYRAYQDEISLSWADVELSSETTWVDYGAAMDIKRVVDFYKNEIRITVQGERLHSFSPADSEREILNALLITIGEAYRIDPLLKKIVGDQELNSQRKLLGLDKSLARSLNQSAVLRRKQGKKGELLTVVAQLPKNSLEARAAEFFPSAEAASRKWQVPVALIMSIMHVESAFNPLACSHVPAFGLMQIVPESAGRGASRLVFGAERVLMGRDLYEPETNIEIGTAYLHILDQKYLTGIVDDMSRQLCVIAAYNAGTGSVARAFTGNTSIKKALSLINRLSAQQVYAHLRSQLSDQETRDYLRDVRERLPLYA